MARTMNRTAFDRLCKFVDIVLTVNVHSESSFKHCQMAVQIEFLAKAKKRRMHTELKKKT